MIIPKIATQRSNYRLFYYHFNAAREAFLFLLKRMKKENIKIILPAYIGFSTREGSGIFDPIKESRIEYSFYRMSTVLTIDFKHLKDLVDTSSKCAVLIVNYFGLDSPNKPQIIKFLREKKIPIIEDNAHSLFSFYNCFDHEFDYAFFSLHKMLPYKTGGFLVCRSNLETTEYDMDFFKYDLNAISNARTSNFNEISQKLMQINHPNITLCPLKLENSVPQTYPLFLDTMDLRDHLYFEMNKSGFGVVSLYHTLISEADESFSVEHTMSARILNLPVHQDILPQDISKMVTKMVALINEFNKKYA
nr:hypothetical protein [uncultured Desulfobacter sp.]